VPHPLAVRYPKAGRVVDGRDVREKIPNTNSIEATFGDDYRILKGVREVPLSDFEAERPEDLFSSRDDIERVDQLAEAIEENREIAPLIVVWDKESEEKGPYVLEGAHRLAALLALRAKSLPALVVIDLPEDEDD
jgi:hypothetical protein